MELLGYAAALIIGVTLGLMGGGGSILTVPVLVYLFHQGAHTATGNSLFIVGTTALVGAGLLARRGLVATRVAVLFVVPAFTMVWLTRRFLLPALPHQLGPLTLDAALLVLFAALMLITAVSMFRRREDAGPPKEELLPPLKQVIGPALLVGLVTGLVGAGGGFLIVPALALAAQLPMKRAVATSLAIIAINSLVGFLSDTQTRAHADWRFLITFTLLAMVGMSLGTVLSRRIPGARLRPAFGGFLLVMGTYMVVRELLFRA